MRRPIALCPGQNRRAAASPTIATSGAPGPSCSVKSRPAINGMRIAAKYPGATTLPLPPTIADSPWNLTAPGSERPNPKPSPASGRKRTSDADSTPGSRRTRSSTSPAMNESSMVSSMPLESKPASAELACCNARVNRPATMTSSRLPAICTTTNPLRNR